MPLTSVSTTVDETTEGRVDVIVRELSETSRAQARGLIDHGCVTINGNPCRSVGTTVKSGDLVAVKFDKNQRYREKKRQWSDRTFQIVFEDPHIVVVNKSAGTLTVPTDRGEPNSLVDRLSIYLSHSKTKKEAFVVHRLERQISGLLVFGKHEPIAELLIEQFKDRRPDRLFHAIVLGQVPEEDGTFDSHLATGRRLNRYETSPGKHTEQAITHYKVLRRLSEHESSLGSDTTLIEATLETSQRNQVRVQFANAGHPVLGDPRYQPNEAKHPRWNRKRIALHASTLGFYHPVSGELVQFESPLPSIMEKFIAGARSQR
ncbi:RluA family pseudouridine synthase [Rhodopirellula sp. JC740]|uniref:RluA family pseudouridine synthase n=1 Tax=Rhodopirellula halodulae TaxID=2894198 RepID=A0ABS8NMK3_9BACT|nr:RluA family pseudouridine synthase [Rhodopirellula sp. JC740]MCC9644765.1 RluA family pseudouridine synthase [Rhodopirellula sp. JC740]